MITWGIKVSKIYVHIMYFMVRIMVHPQC
uniref:Uncharacterized protein n=1 Tax=Rhizophora mucronata TaxID=61149 RepID=A0A2P2IHK5_RHIMU